jgi:quaternary ammonium compound-resistance protein SugE
VGTVGTALLGIALLDDAADPLRLACVASIVGGIIGLELLPH